MYKFKSLDSYDFKSCVLEFFASDHAAKQQLETLDWDSWFYGTGLPPKPHYNTALADVCYNLASQWESLSSSPPGEFEPQPNDVANWTANQLVVFLERVQSFACPLHPAKTQLMGSTYSLTSSKNAEVTTRFFVVALMAGDRTVIKPVTDLLGSIGRMKFVRPLYRRLKVVDEAAAKECFERYRDFYHPICRNMVQKDLFG